MRVTTVRSAGAAAVAAVLLSSGAVAAGASFGARDAVAQPATPYATTTWGDVTLDTSVFGNGGDSVGQLEVSGDGNDQWDVSQGTGELLDSATGTATTNVTTTGPQSALADTNGAYTQLLPPDSDVPWVQQLISQGGGAGGGNPVLQVATWNNRVQCNPPAGLVFLTATTAPTFLGQAVTAPAPTGPGEETTTLNFPADYGDGISDVEVTVVIDHDQDSQDPYYGHMRTVFVATAQPLDPDGEPVGDPVQLFDLVLGDVEVNCEEPQPSPSPSPSPSPAPEPLPTPPPTPGPTGTPTPSPGPTESPTPTPGPTHSPTPLDPSPIPTPSPTGSPSPIPDPTPTPTPTPTPDPTASPTPEEPTGPPIPPEPTEGPVDDDGAPPASGEQPALPVTGAGVAGLVLAGVFSVSAAIAALVFTRKRSV